MKKTSGWFLFLLSFSALADSLYTRDLDCEKQTSGRAREICQALENSLEWTWTGHAIISPSFRITIDGIRQVYCSLPITYYDTELLVGLALDFNSKTIQGMEQVKMNHGVVNLLSVLGQQALDHFPDLDKISDKEGRRMHARYLKKMISLDIEKTSTSIFSPSHRNYILQDGCP